MIFFITDTMEWGSVFVVNWSKGSLIEHGNSSDFAFLWFSQKINNNIKENNSRSYSNNKASNNGWINVFDGILHVISYVQKYRKQNDLSYAIFTEKITKCWCFWCDVQRGLRYLLCPLNAPHIKHTLYSSIWINGKVISTPGTCADSPKDMGNNAT